MTLTVLEAEALGLLDAAVARLERGLTAYRSDDDGLAHRVAGDCRRGQATAHGLYASTLTLLADGAPASEVRRAAALLHVVTRIRHIDAEVVVIAGFGATDGVPPSASAEAGRALDLMERLTLSRLGRARDAYARHDHELAGEVMAAAPEGGINASLLAASAVAVARCLERIEDDAAEIAEQVVCASGNLFEELADGPRLGDLPLQSAV